VNDVAIGYDHICSHLRHLTRRDEGKMGIDYRHERRRLYGTMQSGKPADPSGQIFMQYFEAVRHKFSLTNKE
jgi:hypothetical protein